MVNVIPIDERMKKPKLGQKELVYQDPIQTIHKHTADFGHFQKEYYVRDGGHGVGVVVVGDNSVLLVRQYRFLVNDLSWEIPGGKVEQGERPVETAVRECLEETGIQCNKMEPLMFFYPGTDVLHSPTHLFSCTDWTVVEANKSFNDEIYDQSWVSFATCMEMLMSSQIADGKSIVGLLAYLSFMKFDKQESTVGTKSI